jgi:hypothetical protein
VVVLFDASPSMGGQADAVTASAEAVLTGRPVTDRIRRGTFSDHLQLGPVVMGSRH